MFLLGYNLKNFIYGGGIDFWWGGNKNLVGEESTEGDFSRWGLGMNKFSFGWGDFPS